MAHRWKLPADIENMLKVCDTNYLINTKRIKKSLFFKIGKDVKLLESLQGLS